MPRALKYRSCVPVEAKLLDLIKEHHDAIELQQPVKDITDARRDVGHAILQEGARVDGDEPPPEALGDGIHDRRLGCAGRSKENGGVGGGGLERGELLWTFALERIGAREGYRCHG